MFSFIYIFFHFRRTKKWKKVGEGVYGEVFKYTVSKCSTVVKVIPIEGTNYINSERQKMMFEVYSEILIATELNSLLKKNSWNEANSFCKLKNISCVQGKYPKELIELWKQYDNDKGIVNLSVSIFFFCYNNIIVLTIVMFYFERKNDSIKILKVYLSLL